MQMLASVTTLFERFYIRENAEPLPLRFAYPERIAGSLLATVVSRECVANLVEMY
jgi:hypothetical protein